MRLFRRKRKFFEWGEELEAQRKQRQGQSEPWIISVLLDEAIFQKLGPHLALEGHWKDSYRKGYSLRVDAPKPQIKQKRHVTICETKHKTARDMQASWNDDGTRHDKKTFNEDVGRRAIVQEIAREALKLSPSVALEDRDHAGGGLAVAHFSTAENGQIAYLYISG